jgi:uncharacterized protein (DUF433 family)
MMSLDVSKGKNMARYPLNLPLELKQEAEALAHEQGVSLNQFLMWTVSEKVAALRSRLNDPRFPLIVYQRGAAGAPVPVLARTRLRVQTLVAALDAWGYSPEQAAQEFNLTPAEVYQAQTFYQAHRAEIDAALQAEAALEAERAHG